MRAKSKLAMRLRLYVGFLGALPAMLVPSLMRPGIASLILALGCTHTAPSTTAPTTAPTDLTSAAPRAVRVPSVTDLEASATPGYSPPAPESTTLSVRLADTQESAKFVGWFSEDGKQFGWLDRTGDAGTSEWWGMVPSKRIRVLVLSTAASDVVEVEAPVDLVEGRAQSVDLTLQAPQHKVHTREITVADARRTPIAHLQLELPLDGSAETARDALLNHAPLVTDAQGRVTVRLFDKRPVRLATALPLATSPVVFDLLPSQDNLVLKGVVSCSFTCKDGSEAPHLGYLAIATLKDGTSVKHEFPADDSFEEGNAVFVWPPGATSIVVASNGFTSARISSANARCRLRQESERNCERADEDPRAHRR